MNQINEERFVTGDIYKYFCKKDVNRTLCYALVPALTILAGTSGDTWKNQYKIYQYWSLQSATNSVGPGISVAH